MSTILLADDSPHAQRMGERILREEGFEVSSVTDEAGALARLADAVPYLEIVDAYLPGS
jgi:PleD family two-component response regulator